MSAPPTEQLDLPIEGMTCASCAARIERRLNKLDGVTASVNYATERAAVEYDPARVTPAALVEAVEETGYSARLPQAEPARTETDPAAALRRYNRNVGLFLPPIVKMRLPCLPLPRNHSRTISPL